MRALEVTADIMSYEIPDPYVWDESFRVMVSTVASNLHCQRLYINVLKQTSIYVFKCIRYTIWQDLTGFIMFLHDYF